MRDIYGGAYDALKLPGDLTASSFGKTVRSPRDDQDSGLFKLHWSLDLCFLIALRSATVAKYCFLHLRGNCLHFGVVVLFRL